jgi:hypothetical protein
VPNSLIPRSLPKANDTKTGDHDRGGRGDDPSGVRDAFADCGAGVATVLPLFVDTRDEEDLVVH